MRRLVSGLALAFLLANVLASGFSHSARSTENHYMPATSGTNQSWPMFEHDVMRTTWASEDLRPPLEEIWSRKTPFNPLYNVIEAEGSIFALEDLYPADSSKLHVINSFTGLSEWYYDINGSARPTSMAFVEDSLYLGSNSHTYIEEAEQTIPISWGHIYSINVTSREANWEFELGNVGFYSLLSIENIVYIGTQNGTLIALDSKTQVPVWEVSFPLQLGKPRKVQVHGYVPTEQVYVNLPSHYEECLYLTVASWNYSFNDEILREMSSIYALNSSNGDLLWNRTRSLTSRSPSIVKVLNGLVYVYYVDEDTGMHELQALNSKNGEIVWSHFIPGPSNSFSLDNQYVYIGHTEKPFGVGSRYLAALDALDGSEIWKIEIGGDSVSSIIGGSVLYVAYRQNVDEMGHSILKLLLLEKKDGEILQEWTFDGNFGFPIIANGILFLGIFDLDENSIHALRPPPPTYTLTITTTAGGTTNPAPGTYSYTANSAVEVSTIPNANYLFHYWELDSANVGSVNPYSVLMDKNHELKAVFSHVPPPKPVGGYSFATEGYLSNQPLTSYLTLVAILTIGFTAIKRKTSRKTK